MAKTTKVTNAQPAEVTEIDRVQVENEAYAKLFPVKRGVEDASQLPIAPWLRLKNKADLGSPAELHQPMFKSAADQLGTALQLDLKIAKNIYAGTLNAIKRHEVTLEKLKDRIHKDKRPANEAENYAIRRLNNKIHSLQEKLEKVPAQDRDLYYFFSRAELLEMRAHFQETRITLTPSVKKIVKAVKTCFELYQKGVHEKSPVLEGPTGSGKTEAAIIAAREFSGRDPLVVRCYAGMRKEELYGHQALVANTPSYSKVCSAIEADLQELIKTNVYTAEKIEQETQRITEFHLKTAGLTVSEYLLGLVYQAMDEGRVLIEDEANALRPELRKSLNDLMKKKAGDLLRIQEDGGRQIEVKPGFAFCETVNLGSRYGEGTGARFPYTADEKRRRLFINHGLLPQEDRANLHDTPFKLKELYTIALIPLLDDNAHIFAPPGVLNQIWDLCRYARVTQLAFNDLLQDGDERLFRQGVSAPFRVNPPIDIMLSPAELQAVIRTWIYDGCVNELDHYLYNVFISSATNPVHKAYLYQLASDAGFFQSEGWNTNPDYGRHGQVVEFNVESPENLAQQSVLTDFRQVIEAIRGKAPERKADYFVAKEVDSFSEIERIKLAGDINDFLQQVQDEIDFTSDEPDFLS